MTAQPKPTAAASPWASRADQVATEALFAWEPDVYSSPSVRFIATHQRVGVVLAALADAGLLATAEHDAQVLRDAARSGPVADEVGWWDYLQARAARIKAGDPT